MNLDQETAAKLLDAGAVALFLNAPQNLEFGIDCNTWKIGPKFKGIKFIPPGTQCLTKAFTLFTIL